MGLFLVVQTAQSAALRIDGYRMLREVCHQPMLCEQVGIEHAREGSPLVALRLYIDHIDAFNRRSDEAHRYVAREVVAGVWTISGAGTGTMKRPPSRRYSACCAMISSARFHASSRT